MKHNPLFVLLAALNAVEIINIPFGDTSAPQPKPHDTTVQFEQTKPTATTVRPHKQPGGKNGCHNF